MAKVLDPRKQCLVCDGTGLIPWVFHGERPDGTALIWCEDVMCLSCEGRGTRCK